MSSIRDTKPYPGWWIFVNVPWRKKELGLINIENLSMKMTYLDYVQQKKIR